MWKKVSIYTAHDAIDIVLGMLSRLGITQVEINEGIDAVESYLRDAAPFWDYADPGEIVRERVPSVTAYIAELPENEELIASIAPAAEALRELDLGIDLGELKVVCESVAEEDWANNWKTYYKPMDIGARLTICPSWEECDAGSRTVLKLDPGMAFGTGSHQTTQLCLELIDEHVAEGAEVLDLGCGSGILSIAALLLGAKSALAVDIDPIVSGIARENALMNGIGDEYEIVIGNVLDDAALQARIARRRYDVITANIVASVIIPLSPIASMWLKPEGVFIASGIILDRLEEVRAAIRQAGLAIMSERVSGEWAAIAAVRI
ncbi:MAG: 50S ribosomal protein L11 methyltransferase [Clostridia bacterium]|nr:50S ribosomal protein L11 methyltransferase [Clostridia bacterium]